VSGSEVALSEPRPSEIQFVSETQQMLQVIERLASNPQVDVDKVEKLLQMHERILDRNAKAAYAAALAAMQPELPMIDERGAIKDNAGAVRSKYALWEDVVAAIAPILARHGFSISFRTTNDKDGVTVTAVLTHAQGHSEQTTLTLPIDTSGAKNAVQSVGSSTAYGKRYTAAALLNLRTGEDDDGQRGGNLPTLSESQVADLQALLEETGADVKQFKRWAKVQELNQILAKNYKFVCDEVRARAKAKEARK
jgi:hypothetical protein